MASTVFGAVPADIVARWRPLNADETAIATVLLEDADLKLAIKRPNLKAQITAGVVDGRLAVMVLADVCIRVLANPDAYKSTSVGGDGSVSASYFGTEVLRPRISISDADLHEIDAASSSDPTGYSPVRSRVTISGDYGISY
jgi:hypothetical protein